MLLWWLQTGRRIPSCRKKGKNGKKCKKEARFLFYTEAVYKNKVSKMQNGAPYSSFCRVLLVSSAAPMASPAAPDSLQLNKLQKEGRKRK